MEQDDAPINNAPEEAPTAPRSGEPRRRAVDANIAPKWEAFFQGTDYIQRIREVADLYPEVRSIIVVYSDLDKYDADLAVYLLEHPDLALISGKQAIKNLMHQEMRKADINLRVTSLPRDSRVEIRELRSKHVGKLVSIEGLVRKATEVRPKITDALFQCMRCGHVIKEAQEGLFFKEPMECYKDQDGCGRTGGTTKFKLLTEESRFVDTQKLEVQESPEGLRGGAQPERLTGYLEDDIAGKVAPGDRVVLNGILRSVQKGQPAKSTLFDINLDVINAESQQHEYEDILISPEDEAEIIMEAGSPDLFRKIIASISPTIYGYDMEKESIALQLFGGVAKQLDDGTRIRGDIHILLVGDPGVAKSQILRYMSHLAPRGIYASGKSSSAAGLCVAPETVIIVDGKEVDIGGFVESRLHSPVEVKPFHWSQDIDSQHQIATMSDMCQTSQRVKAIWRIKTPSFLVEIRDSSGKRLTLTPETMVWIKPDGQKEGWVKASDIRVGQSVLVQDRASNGMSDFRWTRIVERRKLEQELPPFVYDLTVEDSHCFLGNGFVVHNTAAAVKDDFGEGRWTLEAGALVLADKGMACIEENQPVVTAMGVKTMKEVRPGDVLLNFSDGPTSARVKYVIDKGFRETIKLRLYSGEVIECTPDHQVLTSSGWKQAGELRPKDSIKVPASYSEWPVLDREHFERGFIHGFGLCDIYYNESSPKNGLGFAAAMKNKDRTDHVVELLERHYGATVGSRNQGEGRNYIRGQEVNFSERSQYYLNSKTLKGEISTLFHHDVVPLLNKDYCIGFLAGVLSTDCCVSHKRGTYGIKHVIDIGIGRRKYGPGWTERKQRLLIALLNSFGIMAVMRRRRVCISSLDSYNRVVELIGPHVVGKNRPKLYKVVPTTKISSYDTRLDDQYVDWLRSVKFNTSMTVKLGLHSRIFNALKKGRVTTTLMDTLRPHWSEITDEGFKEPNKNYLLNPVVNIETGGLRPVYDLTMEGEPNFLVCGGIVHNCIDELDKMTDQDRSSMHEAMESQCYDDRTEVLTDGGWKFFHDVHKEDLVASLSHDGEVRFVKPSLYLEADYDGTMYRIASSQVDLAVTPNHNMYVAVHQGADQWGPYGLHRMDSLPQNRKLRFKKNALWTGDEDGSFGLPVVMTNRGQNNQPVLIGQQLLVMDDWLEFMGYFLSEGWVQGQNGVPCNVHITSGKDEGKCQKVEASLTRLGFNYIRDGHDLTINHQQLASYLSRFGSEHERFVPRELMRLSTRQLNILLDALLLGNGGHQGTRSRVYRTSSKRLADDVQEMALKVGVSANIKVTPGRFVDRSRARALEYNPPHYQVSIVDDNGRNVNETAVDNDGKYITTQRYQGKIYCVEVPDHVLYVRRNGKPVWCGNTISVAKAGITATLQCRCSLLGAANPKYGRFEEHQYIADQINMPPALLSRFDLIFALTDKPNAEKDANITQHILKAHRRGQVRKHEDLSLLEGVDAEKILADTQVMLPTYTREFMRKYVAYSKKVTPVLSDEAMRIISDFYLKIRKQGEGEGTSVPITARQLEAFVRLTEASARARLANVANADDAQRAVKVVDYYLRKIAGEGGKLDFDIIATGTSHSQREQITILKDMIKAMAKEADPKKGVNGEELIKAAAEKGIAEDRTKTLLKRLSQSGELFSPSNGYYKMTSEG